MSKRGELSFQDTTSVGILYDQSLPEKREDGVKGIVLETPILPQTAKVSVTLFAYLVPDVVQCRPIYDQLLRRLL